MSELTEDLANLVRVQAEFVQTADRIEPQIRERAGVCGEWSPKDMVAHLAGWDKALLEFITDVDAFIPPNNVEQFNKQSVESRKLFDWTEMMQELTSTFNSLRQAVEGINTEMKIYARVHSWLVGRTEDYTLHQRQLAAWIE